MSWTQVTTTRRYTQAEKRAYQVRRARRFEGVRQELLSGIDPWQRWLLDELHAARRNGRAL